MPDDPSDAKSLFMSNGDCVFAPNVDSTGRYFVDPVAHYGADYLQWVKKTKE